MISERRETRPMLSVLKIQGGQASDLVLCAEKCFGMATHWWVDRSWACGGDLCPACMAGINGRWICFYPCYSQGDPQRRIRLLELSATSYDKFNGLCRMEGFTESGGMAVHASRKKKGSPLSVTPIGEVPSSERKSLDDSSVWSAIGALYSLPAVKKLQSIASWSQDCEVIACARLKEVVRKM